jgi:hypothetical protein
MIAQEKTEKKIRMSRTSWTTGLASSIKLIIFIASAPKVAQRGGDVKRTRPVDKWALRE